MKNSNVRQSPITRDTLLIADADTKVKHRVPKLLLECSIRQLHNEIIASPDDGGLLGARHSETNDVIISDKMLRYFPLPREFSALSFIIFNCFRRHAFKYYCIYLEVLQMAQPHIIL